MANKTIAQLDTISGSIDNATDLAILYDSSATKTVKTTIQNLLTSQLSGLETSGSNVVSAINELHSKLTETISEIASTETSPASANHQPGELILYDGGLYRTTSYIVIGESLTQIGDGANIESITISDCIKELYGAQSLLGNETMGTDATTVTGAIAEHETDINELDEALDPIKKSTRGWIIGAGFSNIDDMNTNDACGVWWLNCGDNDISGTKPTENGQGVLIVSRQNMNEVYRMTYIGITSYYIIKNRYYNQSSGGWSEWTIAWEDSKKGTLPNNTDLNTVSTPGYYILASGNTYANRPSSMNNLIVFISSYSSSVVFQMGTRTDGRLFFRFRTDIPSTWTSWYQFVGTALS